MSTICHHTISLDGYIAGPDDSMDWAFAHGRPTALADETMNRLGAILAGRRWYGLANERWNGVEGIYGGAYAGPMFVLTHTPPNGGADPRIRFISGGIEEAVASAQSAAGQKDVGISEPASPGSASTRGFSTRSCSTSHRCCSAAASGCSATEALSPSSWSACRSARRTGLPICDSAL